MNNTTTQNEIDFMHQFISDKSEKQLRDDLTTEIEKSRFWFDVSLTRTNELANYTLANILKLNKSNAKASEFEILASTVAMASKRISIDCNYRLQEIDAMIKEIQKALEKF